MLWIASTLVLIVLPAWTCYRRARAQHHTGWLYGLIGLTLSWGGVLITLRATEEKLPDPETRAWIDRLALSGAILELRPDTVAWLRESAPARPDSAFFPGLREWLDRACENGRLDDFLRALQGLRLWHRAYHRWQAQTLALLVGGLGGTALLLGFVFLTILPMLAQLYEGMSLQLPMPTRALLLLFKATSGFGPGLLAVFLGALGALGYVVYRKVFRQNVRRAGTLHRVRAMELCEPGCLERLDTSGLYPEEVDFLDLACTQGRLGCALDLLLGEEVASVDARYALLPAVLACTQALPVCLFLGWVMVGTWLPFYQLVGCLC
ncbi:MAG: hypothetical protein AB1758_28865 [Candidatus Eremiobacterota bacterium]